MNPPASSRSRLPRRRVTAGALAVVALTAACSGGSGTTTTVGAATASAAPATPTPTPSPTPTTLELPGGGTKIYPKNIVVAYYGTAGTDALGVLGRTDAEGAVPRVKEAAAPFAEASGKKVLPAFELISTIADGAPGPSGFYSHSLDDATIQHYVDVARKNGLLVILDIQPGQDDFLRQSKTFEKFLKLPGVGLALDPEWKAYPGEVPGRQIGHTFGEKVNEVSAWLSKLTIANHLPEKLFLVHQFRADMIVNKSVIVPRPGLATMIHMDGFGDQSLKKASYDVVSLKHGELHNGFKLFYKKMNDPDMMTPAEVMALTPRPELITYQ